MSIKACIFSTIYENKIPKSTYEIQRSFTINETHEIKTHAQRKELAQSTH